MNSLTSFFTSSNAFCSTCCTVSTDLPNQRAPHRTARAREVGVTRFTKRGHRVLQLETAHVCTPASLCVAARCSAVQGASKQPSTLYGPSSLPLAQSGSICLDSSKTPQAHSKPTAKCAQSCDGLACVSTRSLSYCKETLYLLLCAA